MSAAPSRSSPAIDADGVMVAESANHFGSWQVRREKAEKAPDRHRKSRKTSALSSLDGLCNKVTLTCEASSVK